MKEWKVTCYYKDPADGAINDTNIHVSDQSFYGTMIDLGVDMSVLDHIIQIEIRPLNREVS